MLGSMGIRAALWPPQPSDISVPRFEGTGSGAEVVYEHARDRLARQSSSFDALDAKAATIIGAALILIGLVLPDLRLRDAWHWLLGAVFLVSLVYVLLTAFMAYAVKELHVGPPAAMVPRAAVDGDGSVYRFILEPATRFSGARAAA